MRTRSGVEGQLSVGAAPRSGAVRAPGRAQGMERYDGSAPLWPHPVPSYLSDNYWWAYVHPNAVKFWERQWLINLILFGNFTRLRDAALDELGPQLEGRTLEVACVYGDFTVKMAERLAPGATLDVVDVLPVQLQNLRRKLDPAAPVTLHLGDSTALGFADATFDQVIVFFLLHEQPPGVRERTLAEAVRVVRPGGRLIVVDYHNPSRWHPLHLVLLKPILRRLEPFASDLWTHEIREWLPPGLQPKAFSQQTYFGGLYQKVALTL